MSWGLQELQKEAQQATLLVRSLEDLGQHFVCKNKRSNHNKVTKFWAGQSTAIILLFLGLGHAMSKIYDIKHWHKQN